MRKVILVMGEENINTFFDVMVSDKQQLLSLWHSVEIFDFETEQEEEAFRLGICAVNGKNTRDFCEITESCLKKLRKRLEVNNSR